QAALAQLRLGERQCKRVRYECCKHRRFCQQRVDTVGLHPFKIVAALQIARQMRRQRGADFGDTLLRQYTFKDQVAMTVELISPGRKRSSCKPSSRVLLCRVCHWTLSRKRAFADLTAASPAS